MHIENLQTRVQMRHNQGKRLIDECNIIMNGFQFDLKPKLDQTAQVIRSQDLQSLARHEKEIYMRFLSLFESLRQLPGKFEVDFAFQC